MTQTSQIFQPWQAWWFAGRHGEVVRGIDGQVKPGYRAGPAWLSRLTRPLIVLAAIALTVLWWRRSHDRRLDALLLLALIFLVRCLLDPWNNVYYAVPFLLCLTAWEGLAHREPPVISLVATVLAWVTFQEVPEVAGADLQSLSYLAWSVPLAAWLAVRALAPGAIAPGVQGGPLLGPDYWLCGSSRMLFGARAPPPATGIEAIALGSKLMLRPLDPALTLPLPSTWMAPWT